MGGSKQTQIYYDPRYSAPKGAPNLLKPHVAVRSWMLVVTHEGPSPPISRCKVTQTMMGIVLRPTTSVFKSLDSLG